MKTKIPYEKALEIATRIKNLLAPACERIEVAGSIRRKRPTVGDIEIVCIAATQPDLFGDSGQSLLEPALEKFVADGVLLKGDKNGARYKEFYIPGENGLKLDLFITTHDQWGLIFTLRTGGEEFSKKFVTKKRYGGFMPSNWRVHEGWIWDGAQKIATPEERDLFKLIGLDWIEPEQR